MPFESTFPYGVPIVVDNLVCQLVRSGNKIIVESWRPETGWRPGGVTVLEVLSGIPASRDLLDKLGIPTNVG